MLASAVSLSILLILGGPRSMVAPFEALKSVRIAKKIEAKIVSLVKQLDSEKYDDRVQSFNALMVLAPFVERRKIEKVHDQSNKYGVRVQLRRLLRWGNFRVDSINRIEGCKYVARRIVMKALRAKNANRLFPLSNGNKFLDKLTDQIFDCSRKHLDRMLAVKDRGERRRLKAKITRQIAKFLVREID